MKTFIACAVTVILAAASASAQQVADSAYHYSGPEVAYPAGTGLQVCVDAGHHNFHTIDGRYLAFANLLRDDGYRVRSHTTEFSAETLSDCEIVVISSATAEVNEEDWAYPHASAFSADEISSLIDWVRSGGSLLLIADHSPWPGSNADLGVLLGAHMLDGYVELQAFGPLEDEALREAAAMFEVPEEDLRAGIDRTGSFGEHVILRGRNPQESVTALMTFGGHAFYPARDMEPLLILGPDARSGAPLTRNLPDAQQETPVYSVGGWLHGGARRVGQGRAVVLGEAAMCTAQLAGPQRVPMGMNNPIAPQNAQFCLNVVHWLSGLLDD
ncbi:MAG TPA: DUF4350 domain-containing protein [Gemmatimonadota bacterium]|nr:DUF4350 domain-containing protein [Gemmatimonadota bacterium]